MSGFHDLIQKKVKNHFLNNLNFYNQYASQAPIIQLVTLSPSIRATILDNTTIEKIINKDENNQLKVTPLYKRPIHESSQSNRRKFTANKTPQSKRYPAVTHNPSLHPRSINQPQLSLKTLNQQHTLIPAPSAGNTTTILQPISRTEKIKTHNQ